MNKLTEFHERDSFLKDDAALNQARSKLVRLAYRFLWNREDAEDVAQEALMIAHRRRDRLRDESKWKSWLYKIVIQRCRDAGRRRRRERRLAAGIRNRAPATPPSASDELEDVQTMLKRLWPLLPPKQQAVLTLRHLEGLSFEEIAEILGVAPSTARVQMKNARESLMKLILQSYPQWAESFMARKTPKE